MKVYERSFVAPVKQLIAKTPHELQCIDSIVTEIELSGANQSGPPAYQLTSLKSFVSLSAALGRFPVVEFDTQTRQSTFFALPRKVGICLAFFSKAPRFHGRALKVQAICQYAWN